MEELAVKKLEWSTESLISQCHKGNIVFSESLVRIDTKKLEKYIELYFNPYHIVLSKIEGHVYGVVKGEKELRTILSYDSKMSGNKDRFYSMPITVSFIENHVGNTDYLKRLLK